MAYMTVHSTLSRSARLIDRCSAVQPYNFQSKMSTSMNWNCPPSWGPRIPDSVEIKICSTEHKCNVALWGNTARYRAQYVPLSRWWSAIPYKNFNIAHLKILDVVFVVTLRNDDSLIACSGHMNLIRCAICLILVHWRHRSPWRHMGPTSPRRVI